MEIQRTQPEIKGILPRCPHCHTNLFKPLFGKRVKEKGETFEIGFANKITSSPSELANMVTAKEHGIQIITDKEFKCPTCKKDLKEVYCVANNQTFQIAMN